MERWDDAPPKCCPYCRCLAYHRVLFAPSVLVKGSTAVDGDRRLVRPRVVQNRDGSETVYTSVGQAQRGELERAAQVSSNPTARALLAAKNARTLVSGLVPGRASTAYRLACEEAPR